MAKRKSNNDRKNKKGKSGAHIDSVRQYREERERVIIPTEVTTAEPIPFAVATGRSLRQGLFDQRGRLRFSQLFITLLALSYMVQPASAVTTGSRRQRDHQRPIGKLPTITENTELITHQELTEIETRVMALSPFSLKADMIQRGVTGSLLDHGDGIIEQAGIVYATSVTQDLITQDEAEQRYADIARSWERTRTSSTFERAKNPVKTYSKKITRYLSRAIDQEATLNTTAVLIQQVLAVSNLDIISKLRFKTGGDTESAFLPTVITIAPKLGEDFAILIIESLHTLGYPIDARLGADDAIFNAIKLKLRDTFKALIKAGIKLKDRTMGVMTIQHPGTLKPLIKSGAGNVNARVKGSNSKTYSTPLCLAFSERGRDMETVRTLLELGADPMFNPNEGNPHGGAEEYDHLLRKLALDAPSDIIALMNAKGGDFSNFSLEEVSTNLKAGRIEVSLGMIDLLLAYVTEHNLGTLPSETLMALTSKLTSLITQVKKIRIAYQASTAEVSFEAYLQSTVYRLFGVVDDLKNVAGPSEQPHLADTAERIKKGWDTLLSPKSPSRLFGENAAVIRTNKLLSILQLIMEGTNHETIITSMELYIAAMEQDELMAWSTKTNNADSPTLGFLRAVFQVEFKLEASTVIAENIVKTLVELDYDFTNAALGAEQTLEDTVTFGAKTMMEALLEAGTPVTDKAMVFAKQHNPRVIDRLVAHGGNKNAAIKNSNGKQKLRKSRTRKKTDTKPLPEPETHAWYSWLLSAPMAVLAGLTVAGIRIWYTQPRRPEPTVVEPEEPTVEEIETEEERLRREERERLIREKEQAEAENRAAAKDLSRRTRRVNNFFDKILQNLRQDKAKFDEIVNSLPEKIKKSAITLEQAYVSTDISNISYGKEYLSIERELADANKVIESCTLEFTVLLDEADTVQMSGLQNDVITIYNAKLLSLKQTIADYRNEIKSTNIQLAADIATLSDLINNSPEEWAIVIARARLAEKIDGKQDQEELPGNSYTAAAAEPLSIYAMPLPDGEAIPAEEHTMVSNTTIKKTSLLRRLFDQDGESRMDIKLLSDEQQKTISRMKAAWSSKKRDIDRLQSQFDNHATVTKDQRSHKKAIKEKLDAAKRSKAGMTDPDALLNDIRTACMDAAGSSEEWIDVESIASSVMEKLGEQQTPVAVASSSAKSSFVVLRKGSSAAGATTSTSTAASSAALATKKKKTYFKPRSKKKNKATQQNRKLCARRNMLELGVILDNIRAEITEIDLKENLEIMRHLFLIFRALDEDNLQPQLHDDATRFIHGGLMLTFHLLVGKDIASSPILVFAREFNNRYNAALVEYCGDTGNSEFFLEIHDCEGYNIITEFQTHSLSHAEYKQAIEIILELIADMFDFTKAVEIEPGKTKHQQVVANNQSVWPQAFALLDLLSEFRKEWLYSVHEAQTGEILTRQLTSSELESAANKVKRNPENADFFANPEMENLLRSATRFRNLEAHWPSAEPALKDWEVLAFVRSAKDLLTSIRSAAASSSSASP